MNKEIEAKIIETKDKIFKNVDIDTLSQYQKRQMIFSYLCEKVKYDQKLLDAIIDCKVNKTKVSRDQIAELKSAILDHVGICSSISQYYKLVLEQVGIQSHCVICDNNMAVPHQLSLVYDSDRGTYSFDDVTSVIYFFSKKEGAFSNFNFAELKEVFFDYDLEQANAKGQGNKKVAYDDEFFILPEDYINFLVSRKESPVGELLSLPSNISSSKNKNQEPHSLEE